ncbi:MAG: hypothetical protein ACK56I_26170, partial [bacterium]
ELFFGKRYLLTFHEMHAESFIKENGGDKRKLFRNRRSILPKSAKKYIFNSTSKKYKSLKFSIFDLVSPTFVFSKYIRYFL